MSLLSVEKNPTEGALLDPANGNDDDGSEAGSDGRDADDGGEDGGPPHGLDDLTGEVTDRNGQHHPIAEFLYQLTKMLTDDNSEVIEWSDGRIKVHYPERLEAEVLHKYFRHSKFASFQRQLNYFGFRKIAGKGKMSPCSYVNEGATSDIRSLLMIKRKTNGSAARKAAMQQRAAAAMSSQLNPAHFGMNLTQLAAASNPHLVGGMNPAALSSAMALLSENALRAGLGQLPNVNKAQLNLLSLQQQQQQIQQQIQQQQQQLQTQQQFQHLVQNHSNEQLAAMFPSQKPPSFSSLVGGGQDAKQQYGAPASKTPSLQELHAQLTASLVASQQQQQQQQQSNGGLNLASLQQPTAAAVSNPATAALQAQGMSMPATAAMDAASGAGQATTNLFESALNLKLLLQEHQESVAAQQRGAAAASSGGASGANQQSAALNQVLNRLPSSGAFLPDSMSTMSLGNLLGSSNRLNSLLSINSLMGSREPSLADFAALSNLNSSMAQFAAANNGATAALAAQQAAAAAQQAANRGSQ